MSILGHVQNGVVVFDGAVLPPDGTAVRVEPLEPLAPGPMSAADLLNSGLVGVWASRTDIGDSREYPRRLREEVQVRKLPK